MDQVDPFYKSLRQTPVIPGIKDRRHIRAALERDSRIIFCLSGTIFDLIETAEEIRGQDVWLFAHVDLIEGIGKDQAGLEFLAQRVGVAGILSTRSYLLRAAQKQGLLTIQRVFAVDSDAVKTGVQVVKNTSPTALEILPGPVVPAIMRHLPEKDFPPVIAGGLIETTEGVRKILDTPGIVSVSTSDRTLWGWHR